MFYEAQRNINSNMREMIKVFKNYKTESESYLNQIIHDDQFEYIWLEMQRSTNTTSNLKSEMD